MDEITGFNEQIGSPLRNIFKTIKRAMTPAEQIRFLNRPNPAQIKRKSMIQKAIMQKKIQARNLAQVIKAQANRQCMSKKPSVNKIFSSKISPTLVKSLNEVQRSYLRTDLPYQKPSPAPRYAKIKNTPFSLPIEIDSIQPPVDAGMINYYGK